MFEPDTDRGSDVAAPDYVPVTYANQPRKSLALPPGRRWKAERPGDLLRGQPKGPGLGAPGPDQGYALALVDRFHDDLRLAEGEHGEDAIAGCVAVALRRASLYGRAPVVHDLELAFGAFGYLDEAPADLVEWRRSRFLGAAHDYWIQRAVADGMPETTLRMTPADIRSRLGEWRTLLAVEVGAGG
ncbi:MAG: hypothetical protein M3144_10400 [Actinomycetota bacterium]|nr:hypothetical protein [Actinomycetota bacterium]